MLCASFSAYTSFLVGGVLFLGGCPALTQVDVHCESSLDCPSNYGCSADNICTKGPESSFTVEASGLRVNEAGLVTFEAKLDGQKASGITWSVDGKGTGTINSEGVYTAPSGILVPFKARIWATLKRHPNFKTSATVTVVPASNTAAWVMSYSQDATAPESVARDSLHLAYSTNGLTWTVLSPSKPAYQLVAMGSNRMRDPSIFRKRDGTFVVLATDWTLSNSGESYVPSPNIVVVDSADLITFKNPRLLKVTSIRDSGGIPMHAWAPEAFYDPYTDQYGILWSGNDSSNINKIYVTYTTSFQQPANKEPIIFLDAGFNAIDPTLIQTDNGAYVLFRDDSELAGDIRIAAAYSAEIIPGNFLCWSNDFISRGSDQSTSIGTYGPSITVTSNDTTWGTAAWYMCARLRQGNFGCWGTDDLSSPPSAWARFPSDMYRFPADAEQTSAVRVTQAELDAIIAHYGTTPH